MISALIISKNEESNIGRCVSSLQGVADEIVVLDSGSTDRTTIIAAELGAKVFQIEWKGYAETKNEGHSHCRYDYILSIDADEELSKELVQSILQHKKDELTGAYRMDRHNFYLGKWIKTCGWYPNWKVRLFNRNEARWTGGYVHEELEVDRDIPVRDLTGALNHYSIQNIEQHRQTVEKYARLAARQKLDGGKNASSVKGGLAFLFTFLRIYILKLGLIEGRRGFLIAYYSALSKWLRQKYMRSLPK